MGIPSLKNKQMTKAEELLANHPLNAWIMTRGWSWFSHQIETLNASLAGNDVLLCAPTGAGKTLSGFLPSFMDLHKEGTFKGLHTLYVSPLKALTIDVHRNIGKPIEDLGLPLTYETRTGDTPASKRARQKNRPPHFLMTTPESLALMLSYPEAEENFKNLRYIIIDELHALMESKRGTLLSLCLERLNSIVPSAQRIGLSATIAEPTIAREWLCRENATIVKAETRAAPEIHILQSQQRLPWSGHMAIYAIPEIYAELQKGGMSIVFVNTRAQAELIFQELWRVNTANLRIALHHGSLEREIRRKVEDKMARGELDCVVATSSLDLGLDWAEVGLVIQIGAPKGVSRLLQRIGRSNHRLNEPSRAILVPTNRFEYVECLAAQDAIYHNEIDGFTPKEGNLDVLAQHITGCACSAPFHSDQLYEEVKRAWPYRHLKKSDFEQVLSFVKDGGYALKAYDQYKRLSINEDGAYELANLNFSRQYRMNIGTIVESPMLKVKMGRKSLGVIEEYFINNLSPGDTFLFAGGVVRFDGLHEMTVMVSRASTKNPKIPSYDGGKLPLSTHLSIRVRELLENNGSWESFPTYVRQWLELQESRSLLPGTDYLLVESFPRHGRHYIVAYPFSGRNAHQTLGFLVIKRMKAKGLQPLGFVATDYAIAFWSMRKPVDIENLFSIDLLGEELHEWLDDTPLIKRTFRENAVIAGLIERRHPGQQKTGRQMTFSSDLIYDVLQRYEPDHILLKAARNDAAGGLIDIGRLEDMLASMQGKVIVQEIKRVSPLAVPLLLEIAREGASRKDIGEYYLQELEEKLLSEAGLSKTEESS